MARIGQQYYFQFCDTGCLKASTVSQPHSHLAGYLCTAMLADTT